MASPTGSCLALPPLKAARDDGQHRRRRGVRPATAAAAAAAAAAASSTELLQLAAAPVLEVALLAGAGAAAARAGLLPPETRVAVSRLTLNVFTPALLWSKLGPVGDALAAGGGQGARAAFAFIACNMVALHATGFALGVAQAAAVVPDRRSLAGPVVVLSSVGNVGNLPLVVVPALAARLASLNAAAGGATAAVDAAAQAQQQAGVDAVMAGFAVACLIQFPLAYLALAPPAPAPPQAQLAPQAQLTQQAEGAAADSKEASAGSTSTSSTSSSAWRERVAVVARGTLTPPVWACLAAAATAAAPAGVRAALFTPGGALAPLSDAAALMGQPMIPCLFLVLGASLSEGPWGGSSSSSRGSGDGGDADQQQQQQQLLPARVVAGAVLGKQVVQPLLQAAAVVAALRFGPAELVGAVSPQTALVALVVAATPTAVLAHSVAVAVRSPGADAIAAALFFEYLAALVLLPLNLALFLSLLQRGYLQAAAAAGAG